MLAGDEAALAVAGVAVGVIARLTEDADPAGLLIPAHDAVIGNVAPQKTTRIAEIDRAFVLKRQPVTSRSTPASASRYLLKTDRDSESPGQDNAGSAPTPPMP